METTAKQN